MAVVEPRLPNCVIPIHRRAGATRIESWGSGVLISAAGHHLLISAAHVLLDDQLIVPGKEFLPLAFAGQVTTTSANLKDTASDKSDLGYALLNQRTVKSLLDFGALFLPVTETTLGKPYTATSWLAFTGFPANQARTHVPGVIDSLRLSIGGNAIPEEDFPSLGFDSKLHVAMRYDRENMEDDRGKVRGYLPHGMSGGAVWMIAQDHLPTLVGIGTDYDSAKKWMRGTRINPLLFRIRDQILSLT